MEEQKSLAKPNSSLWLITSAILAVLLVVSVIFNVIGLPQKGGATVPADKAAQDLISFITEVYGAQVSPVTFKTVTSERGLYKVDFTITQNGQAVDQTLYVTTDGKGFAPQIVLMDDIRKQYQDYQAQLKDQANQPAPADTQVPAIEEASPEAVTQ